MTVIYREDFETDGNGTRYSTSAPEFSDGFGDFFTQTDGSNIGTFYSVTGAEGTGWFAVMDTDGEAPFATTLTLSIDGIDISGYSDLTISGLFAEDDDGTNQDWDANTLVYVEAQIDGGGYFKVLQFASQGATNTEPGLDTDFDGIADGAALTDSFAQFAADIAGMGAVLDLRVTFENLDAGDEDISLDDITVSGTAAAVEVTVLDEAFDDAAAFTTSTGFFSDTDVSSGFDFFGISDGAGGGDFGGDSTPNGVKAYTNTDGSFLTGMDMDGEGAALPVTVTWAGLDISGLSDLKFSGDFGEFFDDPGDIDVGDHIYLDVSIDGGPAQRILAFEGADLVNGDDFNGFFFQDTDFDGTADGAQLGDALASFMADIGGTGSTMDLTMTVSVDSGDEDFAVDNFKIIGTSGGTVTPAIVARSGDGLNVTEGDESFDTFTLELTTAPSAPVTVTVSAPDGQSVISVNGELYATEVQVELTGTDPVEIGVQAVDDDVDETTPHLGSLEFTVAGDDPDYDGLAVNGLDVSITDNDFSITLISDIQGSGDASTLDGQEVTVEAIVTGTITSASGVTGYFIQEEDADQDADLTTSEGIFVFSPNATVSVGDKVRVTATVDEFSDLTELTNVTELVTLDTGVTLPTATQITIGMSDEFEAYEGMRVELVTGGEDPLTVITNFNLDRFGQINVAEGNQTQPTQIFDPQDDAAEIAALAAENAANQIIIDDGSTASNPDTLTLIDSGDGTPLEAGDPIAAEGPTLRLGAELPSVSGIMDERFGDYRIQIDAPLETVAGTNEDARPDTAPDVGGNLTVASFNVLNYFTTLDDGSLTGPNGDLDPRGATTAEDLVRQTQKIVAALVELDADIIGLQELENNGFGAGSAIAALVDALNAELGAGTYAVVDPGVNFVGTDAITTGIIYKPGAVTLTGAATLAFEEASAAETFAIAEQLNAYASSDDQVGDFDRNRPATAATFTDADGNEVTVVSNHFKSKGDSNLEDVVLDAIAAGAPQELIDAMLADPNYDQGDGQGFWNQVRAEASAEMAAWLETNPTGATDGENIVVLGDLNAYAQEDPVETFTDLGYTDLAASFIGEDAYSFVFDGQRGTLDYGLASAALLDNITGVAEWHINADEPDLLNYSSAFNNPAFFNDDFFAASDHDPLVIGLDLNDASSGDEFILARLEFTDLSAQAAIFTYLEDGNVLATDDMPRKSSDPVEAEGSGITIDAEDGTNGQEQLRTTGDGLSVKSYREDRNDPVASHLLDENETISFALLDTDAAGDGIGVAFELLNVSGEGQVVLSFFSNEVLVDQATLDVVDAGVAYDLADDVSFDMVSLGVTDALSLEIEALDLKRIDLDETPVEPSENVLSRLDFNDIDNQTAIVDYSENGTLIATSDVPRRTTNEIEPTSAGIVISGDDGTDGQQQLRTTGDGLSVKSYTQDTNSTESRRIDEDETVTFTMMDTATSGQDALDVSFEFLNVSGKGAVSLTFFDDGQQVDLVELAVVDNQVAYDLAGDATFDEVELGVTGDLMLEIDAIELNRLPVDSFDLA